MYTKRLTIALLSAMMLSVSVALAAGAPSNVTGLAATAIDETSIGLTWTAATASGGGLVNHYRIYYGTKSVFGAGSGDYEQQIDTANNTASYIVTGLTANTTYYFSATAIDGEGAESEEYSLEASAKTLATTGADTTSPTVTSVSAPDKKHVKVVFSEAVTLPVTFPEAAFSIAEQITPTNTLSVTKATLDSSDKTNKTILLETADQTANVNYIITVGVAISDTAGNPIVSGSTDSGLFIGSSMDPIVPAPVTTPDITTENTPVTTPIITEPVPASAVDCGTDIEKCFITHLADCSAAKVKDTDSTYEYTIEITGTDVDTTNCSVKYTADKHPNVLFSGTDMSCKVAKGTYTKTDDYKAAVSTDKCTGDLVAGYKPTQAKDVTPPENVTNLLLSFTKELEKFTVMLNWTASVNTAKDLVDQLVYMSMDRGNSYDAGKSVGPTVTSTSVKNLDGGKEYTFKVTTKDASGNESTGAVKSIRLPQTGMGIGLVLLASAMAAKRLGRRKDNE